MTESSPHEIVEACRRVIIAGASAAWADLAEVAGEVRRVTDCTERQSLQAALDMSRIAQALAPVDMDEVADMARELVEFGGRPGRRSGLPDSRSLLPGPGRE